MNLDRLLKARTVAVIGASNRPGSVGAKVMESLLASGRNVLPINPKHKSIAGLPALPSTDDLPRDQVDLAVVVLPAHRAAEEVRRAAARGVPFIIVVAGGFSEQGKQGASLQQEMLHAAQDSGARLLGPNTIGLWVPDDGPDTLFVEHDFSLLSRSGCVAFLSQSGSVGVEALGAASPYGYRMRAFISLGNKADLDECDFLEHFRDDDRCGCVAMYLESISSGRRFLQAARELARVKPVIVLKAGRTAAGAGAVASHTGALSGSHRVVEGALTQFGLLSVNDDQALLDGAKALALCPPARGGRMAVLTPAGGYGVMAADAIDSCDGELNLAQLSDESRQLIQQDSLEFASVANPVDLTGSVDDDMFVAALGHVLADPQVDLALVMCFLAPPGLSDDLPVRLAQVAQSSDKPVIFVAMHGEKTAPLCRKLTEAGSAAYPSLRQALEACRLLVRRGRWLQQHVQNSLPPAACGGM